MDENDAKINPNAKLLVQFIQNCSPYTAGEVASFPVVECDKLINRGLAMYVQRDKSKGKEGTWKPGDKSNADLESNVEDEWTPEAKAKAVRKEAEEKGEAGDVGDDDDDKSGSKRARTKI